jgi:hypothetical protein
MTKPYFSNLKNEDDLKKYEKWNISGTNGWIKLKFKTEAKMTKLYFKSPSHEDDLQWKIISGAKKTLKHIEWDLRSS